MEYNDVDKLLIRYLMSSKNIDQFLENIESTDFEVTPQKSPKPTEKEEEDEEK